MSGSPRPPRLSPADQTALDALMEAGLDPSLVAPELRVRAEAVGRLLGYLDSDASSADLTDRTMNRLAAAGALGLCEADRAAIDHLAETGWNADTAPEPHRRRARHAVRLLGELRVESVSAADAADLADRTMDLIAMHEKRRAAMDAVGAAEIAPRSRGFRLADLVSIAAMVLIGVAVFWPVVGGVRAAAEQRMCERNLHNAGVGFGLHASDRAGTLPFHQASLLGAAPGLATWWNVGAPERSHSANLYQLVAGEYASVADLACPGNHHAPVERRTPHAQDWATHEEVSYSYQLFGGRLRPKLHDLGRVVLLTDKSPVVVRARRGERVYAEERSHNHDGAGQHALFSDGSTAWLTRPETPSGDNLWLPEELRGIDGLRLRGVELPSRTDDAFVGP